MENNMGIIKAAMSTIGGTLADQWLESIQPDNMDNTTIMAPGVLVRKDDKRNQNKKGSADVITNGSIIHVSENQTMLLVDGGKIVDYSAEPGYFEVNNENAPSLFGGQFKETLDDAFTRLKFGGTTPFSQKVYYINTQEIQDIPFGTPNPVNYFDNFYNAELYLRAHGYYSVRIVNPLKFYSEVAGKSSGRMTVDDLRKIFLAEFLSAFQAAIGKMSAEGERISHVTSKTMELKSHMEKILDADWEERRGMRIESVGIASISYDEQSKKLIDIRNQGAMLSDPTIRTGYVQGAAARGIEAAGSNSAGATTGFMGVGMGTQAAGSFVAAAGQVNDQQAQQQAAAQQAAQAAQPASGDWTCGECGKAASGKFCQNCGAKKPEGGGFCPECGKPVTPDAKFCAECGHKLR